MSVLSRNRIDRETAAKVTIGPEGVAQYLPVLLERQGVKNLVVDTLENGNREVYCGDAEVNEQRLAELLQSFGCFTILAEIDTIQK